MNKITLISGGGRSGKSRHALSLALGYSGRRVFVATAEALDDEIRDRIGKHRAERGDAFITVEEPLDPARALKSLPGDITVAVVDCLTVWLGNLMHHRGSSNERYTEVDSLMSILSNPSCNLIMVTNEVGMGFVPGDPLSRRYGILLGRANAALAAACDRVVLMVAGLPLVVK